MDVLPGQINLSNRGDLPSSSWYKTRKIIVHADFNPVDFYTYDVALVQLDRPVVLNSLISIESLPLNLPRYLFGNGTIVGWGLFRPNGQVPSLTTYRYGEVVIEPCSSGTYPKNTFRNLCSKGFSLCKVGIDYNKCNFRKF